jgi:hypothetical protein
MLLRVVRVVLLPVYNLLKYLQAHLGPALEMAHKVVVPPHCGPALEMAHRVVVPDLAHRPVHRENNFGHE